MLRGVRVILRIAICDDEPVEANKIHSLILQYQTEHPELDVSCRLFSSAEDLFAALDQDGAFDIYLMDIVMPGTDGLVAAQTLRTQGATGTLIFLTSSRDYALDAYRLRALQYLLKPVQTEELFIALDDASARLRQPLNKTLPIHTAAGMMTVRFSTITYVECIRHIMCFHLNNGTTLTSRSIRVPFVQAAAPLLRDERFLHAHKSFIVNMNHVDTLTSDSFLMRGGDRIPVPKSKSAAIRSAYLAFLSLRRDGGSDEE